MRASEPTNRRETGVQAGVFERLHTRSTGRRAVPLTLVLGLLVATVVFVGCGSSAAVQAQRKNVANPAFPLAHDLSLRALNGASLRVQDLHGKVVVLDFMASWCLPCEEAVPHYQRMQRTLGNRGLQVLFVSQDEDRPDIDAFVKRLGIVVPTGMDVGERWYKAYGIKGLPTSVVIGRRGRIRAIVDGTSDDNFLARVDAAVTALLNE